MRVKVAKVLLIAERCYDFAEDEGTKGRASELQSWIWETAKAEVEQELPRERTLTVDEPTRRTGKIKVIRNGFGFIADDAGKDYYFDRFGLEKRSDWANLKCGSTITFNIVNGKKGPCAGGVRREP